MNDHFFARVFCACRVPGRQRHRADEDWSALREPQTKSSTKQGPERTRPLANFQDNPTRFVVELASATASSLSFFEVLLCRSRHQVLCFLPAWGTGRSPADSLYMPTARQKYNGNYAFCLSRVPG